MIDPNDPASRLYTADMASVLLLEARQHGSPAEYIEFLDAMYGEEPARPIYTDVLKPMSEWAGMGSPFSDEEDERADTRAFCSGGLLAMRLAEKCGNAALLDAMGQVKPKPMLGIEGFSQASYPIKKAVLNIARLEYDTATKRAEDLGKLITDWTPALGLEYSKHLIEDGFGLIGHYACLGMVRLGAETTLKAATKVNLDAEFIATFGDSPGV